MSKKYTVEKSTAMVYKIRGECGWADITLREWDRGGSFSCQSDYGNYSHIWTAIGDGTLRDFLCGLDYGYFMNKTRGDTTQFSGIKTLEKLKTDIMKARRSMSSYDIGIQEIDSNQAREYWVEVENLGLEDYDSMDIYFDRFMQTECCEYLYGNCSQSIPVEYEPIWECKGFWENIWPVACEIWKEEKESE